MPPPARRRREPRVLLPATARNPVLPTSESRVRGLPSRAQVRRSPGPPRDARGVRVRRSGARGSRDRPTPRRVSRWRRRPAPDGSHEEQREQTVARVKPGRFPQRQVDQQRDPFWLGERGPALVIVTRPDLDGAQQPQINHEFSRGDGKVTCWGRDQPSVSEPIAHYSPIQETRYPCPSFTRVRWPLASAPSCWLPAPPTHPWRRGPIGQPCRSRQPQARSMSATNLPRVAISWRLALTVSPIIWDMATTSPPSW